MNEAQQKIALEIIDEAQRELSSTFELIDFSKLFKVSGSTQDQKRKEVQKLLRQIIDKKIRK
jgi:hypothetical protein